MLRGEERKAVTKKPAKEGQKSTKSYFPVRQIRKSLAKAYLKNKMVTVGGK